MPVAGQRDPAQVKDVLERWMASKMPDARDVEITDLVVPQSSGFSNETFLLDARWVEADGSPTEARLVLRSQPELHHLFPEIDIIAQQYTVMRQLGEHTDVPVPRTRWAEPDPSVLGGTFFPPSVLPPYLYRIAHDNQDWKMLGTIRGICAQLELYEALLNSCGYRLPPKRRRRREVDPGQLGLFGEVPS
jgi:hypothetical protein